MLVLTRRPGESIRIGRDIRIRLVSSTGAQARLAIEAPEDVTILREELYERIAEANRTALGTARGTAEVPSPREPDASGPPDGSEE